MQLLRRLASRSAIIFLARIAGAGLTFIVQALIARLWGASTLGEYMLIVAVTNLFALVMPLGFHTVGTYFAAEYSARKDRRSLARFMLRAYGHVIIVTILLMLAGPAIMERFLSEQTLLGRMWAPSCLLAAATAFIFINSALLVGLKRPIAGFLADTLFRPLLAMAGFLLAFTIANKDAALAQMLWVLATGYCVIALIHFGFAAISARKVAESGDPAEAQSRRWWRFALPWTVISLATDFFFDIDLVILSVLLGRHELAIFGICTRIFSLVSFGVASVYAVTLPEMFESEARNDREGFHQKLGEANLLATGIAALFFIVLSLGGPFVLLLFGPEFLVGSGALSILCLALVVRSIMGPASLVLSINDRPHASLPAVAVGLVTLAAADFILVPMFGLYGAAIAALLAISGWAVVLWFIARTIVGIDVSVIPHLMKIGSRKEQGKANA